MSTGNKTSLGTTLVYRFAALATLLTLILGGAWATSEYRSFTRDIERTKSTFESQNQAFVKELTRNTVAFVNTQRETALERARAVLKARIEEALGQARNLHRQFAATLPRDQLETLIIEALRPIRFNDGRGYFFILDLRGVRRLANQQTGQEGKNVMDIQDVDGRYLVREIFDLVDRQQAGFLNAKWGKPGNDGKHHRKELYVAELPELGWIIGTGEYSADITVQTQQTILSHLESIRYGDDGYMFSATYDGASLVGPGKGKNVYDVTDVNGKKVVQELIQTAKDGGGFVSYVVPSALSKQPTRKVSYVEGIPEWNWYVGAGFSLEEMERRIALREKDIANAMTGILIIVGGMVGLLLLIVLLAAGRESRRIRNDNAKFQTFFAEPELAQARIDPGSMTFAEFERIAEAAQNMVNRQIKIEAQLKDATEQAYKSNQDLQHTLEELTRSNADLQQFAYIASHDLREPLRMVGSYLQLLKRRYQGKLDDEATEYIGYAVQGAQRMDTLVKDLLQFSRVKTHGEAFERVDVEEVLELVLDNLKPRIQSRNAVVLFKDMPCVMGDPTQILQLFQNLVGNALKYCYAERTPEVTITATERDGAVEFAVSDNGIGIEAQYFDRIFVIFQRLHRSDEYEGTGVGLAICMRIIERHGGRLWVESEPGQGSTFRFTLPHPCPPEAAE